MTRADVLLTSNAIGATGSEIEEIDNGIIKIQAKIRKQKKFAKVLQKEIDSSAEKIHQLEILEVKSKTQIDQNIEMLTWLVDSIDDTSAQLKNNMDTTEAILENVADLEIFVSDLEDILDPLKPVKGKGKSSPLTSSKIRDITQILEIFFETFPDSIDSITEKLRRSNSEAIKQSTKEFDEFINDIHSVFDTFNGILQQLKLTNSTRKYLALEEIYGEIDKIVKKIKPYSKSLIQLQAQKAIKQETLASLKTLGLKKEASLLNLRKQGLLKEKDLLQHKLNEAQTAASKISEELEFIELEKTTIRDWFQALTDEVVDNQNTATETYNIMFSTLDQIHGSLFSIKTDFKAASEAVFNKIILEFISLTRKLGKIVAIINKIDKVSDPAKKQAFLYGIHKKSMDNIRKIWKLIKKLGNSVNASNDAAIAQSFLEFDKFVQIFKEKFYFIQDAVSAITLSSSSQLITDLQTYSEQQSSLREQVDNAKFQELFYSLQLDSIKSKLEGVENDLKVYSKDTKKRRKILKIAKKVIPHPSIFSDSIQWTIKNAGLTSLQNFQIGDAIPSLYHISSVSQEFKRKSLEKNQNALVWTFDSLPKRETVDLSYTRRGFFVPPSNFSQFKNNITTVKEFRYHRVARSVQLSFMEYEGSGAFVLTNTGEKDTISNIILEFSMTAGIDTLPNVKISQLAPQQSYVKKYQYTKPHSLKPSYFFAQTAFETRIYEERSMTVDNEYQCDITLENTSEFLLFPLVFRVSQLIKPHKVYIDHTEKDLDLLRPKFDLHYNFMVSSKEDPPALVSEILFTPQLVYEYSTDPHLHLQDLQETPELEFVSLAAEMQVPVPESSQKIWIQDQIIQLKKIDQSMLEIEQFILQAEKEIEKRRQILAEQRVERENLALRIKEARGKTSAPKRKTKKKQSTLAPKKKTTSSKRKSTSSKRKSTSSKTKTAPKKQAATAKKKVVPRKKKTTKPRKSSTK
jgi:hypothetical protein